MSSLGTARGVVSSSTVSLEVVLLLLLGVDRGTTSSFTVTIGVTVRGELELLSLFLPLDDCPGCLPTVLLPGLSP